ncbi:rhodanese-like domain-containing protein [Sulfurovum sp. ST-21]|uniref:Rhodanese-like domain-containing protein n=1 Tax=Sulfurovum indicum TaxID=2779528 RepID=A0A7M1S5B5_9BACT|nr:rhodanese-like domain-containing protein [Sulfurovum indicum]QOR62354.1 rhodanese-like domain-containing protein [Sulfurovum indicum]
MKLLLMLTAGAIVLCAGKYDKVKITPEIAYIYVYHKGKAVKIHRIQDTKNKLTGEYAKTYRPGQDIQPIKMQKDIQTIGEVELLHFLKEKVNRKKGLLVDLRTKKYYQKESIPGAVNIPFATKNNHEKMEKILKVLGAKRLADGTLDTTNARTVAFYCHGLWCAKSSKFIKEFLKLGYPAEKILYYRGGFQMWKILGFTTVSN